LVVLCYSCAFGLMERQFSTMLAIMGAGLALLTLRWLPLAFAFACVLAGIVMAPALIIQSCLKHSTGER
jgi:hypothetical protein